jgi:hypothetical protein
VANHEVCWRAKKVKAQGRARVRTGVIGSLISIKIQSDNHYTTQPFVVLTAEPHFPTYMAFPRVRVRSQVDSSQRPRIIEVHEHVLDNHSQKLDVSE